METKEVNADRELLKALAQDGLFADGFLQWLDRYGVNVATIDGLTDDRKLNLAYAIRCQVEPFEKCSCYTDEQCYNDEHHDGSCDCECAADRICYDPSHKKQ